MPKMADAAAARREARRRRILENSHNRLQLISGKNSEDCSRGSSPIRRTTTEQDSQRFCINNGVIVTEQETFESFSSIPVITSSDNDGPVSEGEVVNELAFFTPPAPETVETPLLEKLVAHKYDIVLLSLLNQFLYSMVLVTDTTYYFLPILMYSVTKMIYFPSKSHSNLTNVLMLLNNMSSSSIQRIIQLLQTGSYVFGDVCIFLFVTICIQCVCSTVKDSLIT